MRLGRDGLRELCFCREQGGSQPVGLLLELGGIDIKKTPLTKEEKRDAYKSMLIGAIALVEGAIVLDAAAINPITDSIKGLDKDGVAYYGVSMASSLPEFAISLAER